MPLKCRQAGWEWCFGHISVCVKSFQMTWLHWGSGWAPRRELGSPGTDFPEEAEFSLMTLRADEYTFLWAAWEATLLRAVCGPPAGRVVSQILLWAGETWENRTHLQFGKEGWTWGWSLPRVHGHFINTKDLAWRYILHIQPNSCVCPYAHLTFSGFSSFEPYGGALDGHSFIYSIQKYLPSPYCLSDAVLDTMDTMTQLSGFTLVGRDGGQ